MFFKLIDIISIKKGKKPKIQSEHQQQGFMPYVDIAAFETGRIKMYTDGEKCLPCNNGDLLIVCDGSRSGLIGKAIKGYVGSTLARIDVDETVSKDYIYYFIQGKYSLLNTNVKGTGTPHVNQELLKSFEIPVPPLPEQERIVARIKELFSELDKAVETLKKTKEQLAVYRQAVLKEAFGKVEDTIWLGEIIDSRLGKMLDKTKNVGTPRQYLRNTNVRWFSFDLSDLLEMKIEDDEIEKYSVDKGDLVICEGGEPGRCAIWEKDYTFFYQKALHRVRFTDGSNPKFYMYYLWFSAQTGQLARYFTGTGIKHLTGQSLNKVTVPTALKSFQDKIVSEIESHLFVCDSIEKTIDTALQESEAMRQSILKKAFEGGFI